MCRGFPQCTDVGERERWMCRGFPQAVQDVAVQRHLGSDLSPLGPTLAQLLLAIVSTYSCAAARPYPTLMRHVVVLSGSYPTYPCDGLLVLLAPRTQPIAVFPSLLAHPHALEPGCVSTLSPRPPRNRIAPKSHPPFTVTGRERQGGIGVVALRCNAPAGASQALWLFGSSW